MHVWTEAVPSVSSREACRRLSSPGHSGQGPDWSSHYIYVHQDAEQGAWDWGPMQGQTQVSWLLEDQTTTVEYMFFSKSWSLTKFNADEFNDKVTEK